MQIRARGWANLRWRFNLQICGWLGHDIEILLYRGWVVNLDSLEVIEEGEQSKEIERKLNALIKALDYRELARESFVDKSYFANTKQDENYIDL